MGSPAALTDEMREQTLALAVLIYDNVENDGPRPFETVRAFVQKLEGTLHLTIKQHADGFDALILQLAQLLIEKNDNTARLLRVVEAAVVWGESTTGLEHKPRCDHACETCITESELLTEIGNFIEDRGPEDSDAG